jgi:hypothetical protein
MSSFDKPCTHFEIRQEAYKRITEALEQKEIRYAHRKVIVDLAQPESSTEKGNGVSTGDAGGKSEPSDPDSHQSLKAGAAAALETIPSEEKDKADTENKKESY